MGKSTLVLGLITDVFVDEDAEERLYQRLSAAKSLGAELAVLPELPLNRWSPATKEARDIDAEPPEGRRHQIQASAARAVGVGLVGGVILKEPTTGARYNTALIFDAQGKSIGSYRKLHLPQEDGFWETSHYQSGNEPPVVIEAFGVPFGIQICSDVNRPELSHVLGALGAEAILAPRSTPLESYERWKLVLRANAVTSGAYVVSTNRPRSEERVPIGGPSIVVAPDGEVLLETEDPVGVVTLDREVVRRSRMEYPGYLAVRADLYRRAWEEVAGSDRRHR